MTCLLVIGLFLDQHPPLGGPTEGDWSVLAEQISRLEDQSLKSRTLAEVCGLSSPNKPPIQITISPRGKKLPWLSYTMNPKAAYAVDARVLSVKKYLWWQDKTATISPIDIALGWGKMSEDRLLGKVEITQSNRYYHYWYQSGIDPSAIAPNSSNHHLIPASPAVWEVLRTLKKGDRVKLCGWLVDVTRPRTPGQWVTSMSREDQGAGACEIVLVEKAVRVHGGW